MVFIEHPEFSFNALIQWHPNSGSNSTLLVKDESSTAPGRLVGSDDRHATNSAAVRLTCGSADGIYYYEITGDQRAPWLRDSVMVAGTDGWVRFVALESAVLGQTAWTLGVDPKAFEAGSQVDIVLKDGRGRIVRGVEEGGVVHLSVTRGEPLKLSLRVEAGRKGGPLFDKIAATGS